MPRTVLAGFDARLDSDLRKYRQFARATTTLQRARIETFLNSLPLGLEREDLRVIHAAWHAPDVAKARSMPLGGARAAYDHWETQAAQIAVQRRIAERMAEEKPLAPQPGRWRAPPTILAGTLRQRT